MNPCAWCGVMTDKTIFVELVRKTITMNPSNALGNTQRKIKSARTAPCCERCKKRIEHEDESTVDLVQGVQLDVYEVIELIEKGEA